MHHKVLFLVIRVRIRTGKRERNIITIEKVAAKIIPDKFKLVKNLSNPNSIRIKLMILWITKMIIEFLPKNRIILF